METSGEGKNYEGGRRRKKSRNDDQLKEGREGHVGGKRRDGSLEIEEESAGARAQGGWRGRASRACCLVEGEKQG